MSEAATVVFDDTLAELALGPVDKLARDVRNAGRELTKDSARFIVDTYYRFQEHRIALSAQVRSVAENGGSVETLDHFAIQTGKLEKQMVGVLDAWTDAHEVGIWAKSITGIGPVLSAGLLAHIDIERATTAGAIWRFAGYDPSVRWEKGEKRPWNADLKVLCWKIGDSFVKQSSRESDYYGHLYRERKAYEVERNTTGGNAEYAAETLTRRAIRDRALKAKLEEGILPDGQIDNRARRWAVKLFLSHWHEIAYAAHYHVLPPAPYVMAHQEHVHYRPVPNQPGWFQTLKMEAGVQ